MAKFCANCGAPLQDNEKFCGKCGAKVEDLQPAGQASASNGGFSQAQQNIQQAEQNIQQTQQSYNQPAGSPVPQPAAPKGPNPAAVWVKGHIPLLAILLIGILVIVAGIIILINVFKYQVIDPKDIAAVEFTGPDGVASVAVTLNDATVMKSYYLEQSSKSKSVFDYDFYKKNIKKLTADDCSDYFNTELKTEKMLDVWTKADDKSDAKRMMNALLKMKDGEYVIKFEPDKTEGLKNGDKIKIKVDYDEEYLKEKNIKLSSDEFEVEVKELKKGEKLDMFKDVSLNCNGYNGSAVAYDSSYYADRDNSITINYKKASDYVKYSFTEFSDDEDKVYDTDSDSDEEEKTYSNGDKIKVYATLKSVSGLHETKKGTYFTDDDKCYIVSKKNDSKEFEVTGLKDAQELDVFKDIKFDYYGAAPKLKIYSAYLPDDTEYSGCVYYKVIGNSEKLKFNDKFKVVAAVDPEALASKGYKITEEPNSNSEEYFSGDSYYSSGSYDNYKFYSKEFTVDDSFAYYITTKEDAMAAELDSKNSDDENIFGNASEYLKKEFTDASYISVVKALKGSGNISFINDVEKVTECTYVGSCLSYASEATDYSSNYIARIYRVTVVDDDKKTHKFYSAAYVPDMYKDIDGTYKNSYSTLKILNYTSPELLYQAFSKNDGGKLTLVKYKNTK